jgi:hypothetical protein
MSSRAGAKAATRERVAAMRAAEARAQKRRRVAVAATAVAAVVVLIAALVLAKAAGLGSGSGDDVTAKPSGAEPAPASVVRAVTSVPASVFDEIGVGDAQAAPTKIDAPALSEGGKPKVLYVGAEYCPYCAAERWAVVAALARFGTWSNLAASQSATNDVYPETQTFSFHGASYSSDYLSFTGVETATNEEKNGRYAPLDELSPADEKIFRTYDQPPYVQTAGAIPFLDIGGRYVNQGASLSPEVLQGKSRAEIAAALSDPTSPIAKAVGGAANVLTASLCEVTGNQPADVCSSPGVTAAAKAVAGAQKK